MIDVSRLQLKTVSKVLLQSLPRRWPGQGVRATAVPPVHFQSDGVRGVTARNNPCLFNSNKDYQGCSHTHRGCGLCG